ncbi:MAG: ATP-binding protein [Bacteroidales bacterium]|nr:ATP-binding protein [Candidatus Colimorpha pelethequi]
MKINRPKYIEQLLNARENGLIKIVTGMRRCGKSYLLSNLFVDALKQYGVNEEEILFVNMDSLRSRKYRNPEHLLDTIELFCNVSDKMHYVIIDEVQMVEDFTELLNSLLHIPNLDVYVTGSNSRFLSTDIATEFRGRSYEIHLFPLSFADYLSSTDGDLGKAWDYYKQYGGLPALVSMNTEERIAYLKQLSTTLYLRDIVERHNVENTSELRELIRVLASSVGSLTNATNLSNTFASKKRLSLSDNTVSKYIKYFEEAFLIEKSVRYDIRGKQYIGAQAKYYFQDVGIRNALLSFRQSDDGHVMENVIYNELCSRGYSVDVGNVIVRPQGMPRQTLEVDFVANKGSKRYYIQSAYQMLTDEKIAQEKRSLLHINDSFKKIVLTMGFQSPRHDEDGIVTMGLYQFLSDPDSLDR